jgi:hypothetical protein
MDRGVDGDEFLQSSHPPEVACPHRVVRFHS